jgi:hypothetical protein
LRLLQERIRSCRDDARGASQSPGRRASSVAAEENRKSGRSRESCFKHRLNKACSSGDRVVSATRFCLSSHGESRKRRLARLRWRNRPRLQRRTSGRSHSNGYRDFDPATGRYVESDPLGLEDWLHRVGNAISRPCKAATDECFNRYGQETERCEVWRGRGPLGDRDRWYRACKARAADPYRLCVRNNGQPNPEEPDEWSRKDVPQD